jgi:H+-translocating NAD(P) transhydrogenase subunit alpha
MALTNALSAIALVISIVILGQGHTTYAQVLGFIAVVASSINVVGGFIITDRMLKMFRLRGDRRPAAPTGAEDGAA